MRNNLEQMQRIEQYITGAMSNDEKADFDKELAAEGALREALRDQKDLMQGAVRPARRQLVEEAGRNYRFRRASMKWGIAAGSVFLIVLAVVLLQYFSHHEHSASEPNPFVHSVLPALNEDGLAVWAQADSLVPAQYFTIDPDKDTVIETSGGLVLSVPAGAFLNAQGNTVQGSVELCIKDALDAASVIQSRLSTMAGNRELETAGMFYLDARQGSSILRINPVRNPVAVVPAQQKKPGMMAFKGARTADGSIDWKVPVALAKELIPVDILKLDFYPPGYLYLLRHDGYPAGNKHFTDSIYFSDFYAEVAESEVNADDETSDIRADSISVTYNDSDSYPVTNCGIRPASIKTIWSTAYSGTLLATREFHERLGYIHALHEQQILDLYVKGLNRNLYELDSLAARLIGSLPKIQSKNYSRTSAIKIFQAFAARRDGKVPSGNTNYEQLARYFDEKTKLYEAAFAKTQKEVQLKLNEEARAIWKRRTEHTGDSTRYMQQALTKNFTEELENNMESAYRQLGKLRAIPPSPNSYFVNVSSTGWWNVDRYVFESTMTRNTMNYTDPETGKTAIIRYDSFSVSIADAARYDQLMVYLIPDKLSCFMKMPGNSGLYTEKLNGLITYDLVCIGVQDSQRYYFKQKGIRPGTLRDVALKSISGKELNLALNGLRSGEDASFLERQVGEAIWEMGVRKTAAIREKWSYTLAHIRSLIYPCMDYPAK